MTMSTRFSHRLTIIECEQTSIILAEKLDTVLILVCGFAKNVVVSKQVKNMAAVLPFFDRKKGSFTSYKNNWASYTANKQ